MADTASMALDELVRKAQLSDDVDFLRAGVHALAQALMEAEVTQHLGAGRYERTAERSGERNGHRERRWDTRVGSITLRVPRVRDGSYFPTLLEPRRRAERALVAGGDEGDLDRERIDARIAPEAPHPLPGGARGRAWGRARAAGRALGVERRGEARANALRQSVRLARSALTKRAKLVACVGSRSGRSRVLMARWAGIPWHGEASSRCGNTGGTGSLSSEASFFLSTGGYASDAPD